MSISHWGINGIPIVHTYVRTLRCRTHILEPSDPCLVRYVLISENDDKTKSFLDIHLLFSLGGKPPYPSVFMFIFIYVFQLIFTLMYSHVCIQIYINVYEFVYMNIYIFNYIYVYIHVYILYIYRYIYTYT
jgi:hypothetical protein